MCLFETVICLLGVSPSGGFLHCFAWRSRLPQPMSHLLPCVILRCCPFVQVHVNTATASQRQVSSCHSCTRSLSSPPLTISSSSQYLAYPCFISSPATILYRSLLSASDLPSGIVDSYLRSCTSLFQHHQSCSPQSTTQRTRSSKPRTLLLTSELRPAFQLSISYARLESTPAGKAPAKRLNCDPLNSHYRLARSHAPPDPSPGPLRPARPCARRRSSRRRSCCSRC
jgi:hypothetical protein